jgi:REP element-mobilizing transposase RayT
MPRKKRIKSSTGTYHVMVRGNERKDIFNKKEDKERFMEILSKTKRKTKFELYAYCLMGNHFHLVIREKEENISSIMKRLNVSYAYYFNKKYDRVGHVFQGRYKSEPIEDDKYLLAAVRYVHNNPVKAGFVKNVNEYKWSSYGEYLDLNGGIIDRDLVLGIFSEDIKMALTLFKDYNKEEDKDCFIDVKTNETKKIIEIRGLKEAEVFINEYIKEEKIELPQLNRRSFRVQRNKLIKELRARSNLSIREIARLLKLNRGMVSRALK